MIKTVWIDAYFLKKGVWEEYEEPTGEVKKGLFGTKAITVKKKRWVELNEHSENRIDGKRLSDDTQKILSELESSGYEVLNITPVISGNYGWQQYGRSGHGSAAASTCASWGYSVTEGIMITAKKN